MLVGAGLHSSLEGGMVVAISASEHVMNPVRTDDCPIAPDGGCIPWFPDVNAVSLLIGWESKSTNLRVLGGPALASPLSDRAPGAVVRADGAAPLWRRVSPAATLSLLYLPERDGDSFHYVGFGVGLRLR